MPGNDNRTEAILSGQRQAEDLKKQDLKDRQLAEAGNGLPQSVKDSLDASAQRLTKNNEQNDTSKKEEEVKKAWQQMESAKKEQPKMGQGDPFQMGMAYLNAAVDKAMKVATAKQQMQQGQKAVDKMKDTNTVNKVRDDVNQNGGSFTEKLLDKVKQELGPKADHVQVRDRFNKMIKNLTIKGENGKPLNDKQKESLYLTESELKPVPVLDKNGDPVTKNGQVQMQPGTDLAATDATTSRNERMMAADIVVQNPAQSDTTRSDNAAKPADSADNSKQQQPQQQQPQQQTGLDTTPPTPTPSNN